MSEVRDLPADAIWFRQRLADLGLSQSAFAREIEAYGDPRDPKVILRGINRIATGIVNVSGELHVILNLLAQRMGQGSQPFRPSIEATSSLSRLGTIIHDYRAQMAEDDLLAVSVWAGFAGFSASSAGQAGASPLPPPSWSALARRARPPCS